MKTLLLSKAQSDHDHARDIIAALLTRHKGEYVLRLGAHPPHAALFTGEVSGENENWTGTLRTEEEINVLYDQITRTVEEVGGKVRTSSMRLNNYSHSRRSLPCIVILRVEFVRLFS